MSYFAGVLYPAGLQALHVAEGDGVVLITVTSRAQHQAEHLIGAPQQVL